MFTPQEFNTRIEKSAPPKGWVWVLLGSIVKKWLYENADEILKLLLEHLFGKDKATRLLELATDKSLRLFTEEEPAVCTEPKPTEPPYGGSVNGEWKCIRGAWTWIEDIG